MKMTDVITGLRSVKPELKKALDESIESFKSLKNLSADINKVSNAESKDALYEKLELGVLRAKEAVTDLGILVEKVCQISDLYTRELSTEKQETEAEPKKDEAPLLPGMEEALAEAERKEAANG